MSWLGAIVEEPFSENKLSTFTFIEGSEVTGLNVAGGRLEVTDQVNHSFLSSAEAIDSFHQIEVLRIGTPAVGPLVRLWTKYISPEHQIGVFCFEKAIRAYVNNTEVDDLVFEFTPGVPEWFWTKLDGNLLRYGVSTKDPRIEGALETGTFGAYTLTGESVATIGAGKQGRVGTGLAHWPFNSNTDATSLDDWIVTTSPSASLDYHGVMTPHKEAVESNSNLLGMIIG